MQHLPILKICSCPCQAGPNAAGELGEEQDQAAFSWMVALVPSRAFMPSTVR